MIPFLIILALVAAVATSAVDFATRGRSGGRSYAVRVAISCVVLIALPFALEVQTARRLHMPHVIWADLRWYTLALPLFLGHIHSLVRLRHNPDGLPAFLLCSWSSIWTVLNTTNHCAPGWCRWYGFPLPFYSWSDAIISFNGNTPSPFHPIALAVDLGVLAFVIASILKHVRHVPRLAA